MCRPIELRFWTTLGTRRISVTAAEAFALTRQPIGHTPSDRWASDFKLATHYNAEFPGEAPVGAKLAETTRVKPGSGTNIDAQLMLNSLITSGKNLALRYAPGQSRNFFDDTLPDDH